jgi:hypothetical protein
MPLLRGDSVREGRGGAASFGLRARAPVLQLPPTLPRLKSSLFCPYHLLFKYSRYFPLRGSWQAYMRIWLTWARILLVSLVSTHTQAFSRFCHASAAVVHCPQNAHGHSPHCSRNIRRHPTLIPQPPPAQHTAAQMLDFGPHALSSDRPPWDEDTCSYYCAW